MLRLLQLEMADLINLQYCYDYTVNQISFGLLLYSHLPAAVIALALGVFILIKAKDLSSVLFFSICFTFALWCVLDLSSWFSFFGSANTLFTWSLLDLLAVLMFFFTYWFLYVFITGKDLPKWQKWAACIVILPTAVIALTGNNLPLYDANICEAVENESLTRYAYFAEAIFILAIAVFAISTYRKTAKGKARKQVFLASIGTLVFLLFFFSSTFLVSLLAESDAWEYVYNYEIYGLFGMPIFLAYFVFLIVRYSAFNIKMFGAQALTTALLLVLGSELAFANSLTDQILVGVTLILTSIVGLILVKSVRREIQQREKIETLAENLETTNVRLLELDKQKSEFVSLASHQLRGPLTAIKGYASMLVEGDYGSIGSEVGEILKRIQISAHDMARLITDYLDVSRIELGRMKYTSERFSMRDLVQEVAKEIAPNIPADKVKLSINISADSIEVVGDRNKLKQVVGNFIDNAVKYTPRGEVQVSLARQNGKARFEVRDNGLGISPQSLAGLFQKFARAQNASKSNIRGTGLGLYIAKTIVDYHKGAVSVKSDGEGKGSTFAFEIPLAA